MMDAGTGEVGDGNPRRPCGSGLGFKPCWPVLCGNENLPIVFWAGITYMIYLRVSAHHLREIPARLGRRQEITTFPRDPSQPPLAAASRGLFRNFHKERPKPIAEPKFQSAQSRMSGHAGGGFPRYGCAAGSLALVARYMPMRWRHRAKLQLHICSRLRVSVAFTRQRDYVACCGPPVGLSALLGQHSRSIPRPLDRLMGSLKEGRRQHVPTPASFPRISLCVLRPKAPWQLLRLLPYPLFSLLLIV